MLFLNPSKTKVFLSAFYWFLTRFSNFKKVIEKRHVNLFEVRPFNLLDWHHGAYYFTAQYNDKKVFIKTDFYFNLLKNEVEASHALKNNALSSKHVLSPLFYDETDHSYIAYEYIDAKPIDVFISNKQPDQTQLDSLIEQISHLIESFYQLGIVHRDLKAENFFVTHDNRLIVIDFLFSVSVGNQVKLKELQPLNPENKKVLENMGEFAQKQPLVWDDAFSIVNMLEQLSSMNDGDFKASIDLFKRLEGRLEYKLLPN